MTKKSSEGRVTQSRSDGRVTCHVCGSLFDTQAPPCPQFDRGDPAQTKTCDTGEACLYYKWKKADDDFGELKLEQFTNLYIIKCHVISVCVVCT